MVLKEDQVAAILFPIRIKRVSEEIMLDPVYEDQVRFLCSQYAPIANATRVGMMRRVIGLLLVLVCLFDLHLFSYFTRRKPLCQDHPHLHEIRDSAEDQEADPEQH